MQRAGGAREVLLALCRALSASGALWDPEVLRKSKFNRPEATPEFWKLLYCLLKQIYPGEEDLSASAPEKNIIANQVLYVKRVLQTQGYGRPAFYALPHSGEEGSREVLLAFSWLLCRVKILEIMLEKNRVKVGDHVTVCTCTYDKASRDGKDHLTSTKRNVDIRYIQWLSGKLQLCRRTLYAAHLEQCAILYKIHSYTQGCHTDRTTSHLSVMETELVRQPKSCDKIHSYTQGCHTDRTTSHLSVMETELVRQPKSCDKLLQSLELENSYLEAYLEWKHLEPVYWRWMETVLQSASEDEQSITTPNINMYAVFSHGYRPKENLHDIQALSTRLRGLIEQLHELTSSRKLLWQEQSKDLERDLSQKELRYMIKILKQEARKKLEHLKRERGQCEDLHGSFRVICKESKLHKTAAHKQYSAGDLHATEVIAFLRGAISSMAAEYEELQDLCRRRLDEITERLEGVICIPPTKC